MLAYRWMALAPRMMRFAGKEGCFEDSLKRRAASARKHGIKVGLRFTMTMDNHAQLARFA